MFARHQSGVAGEMTAVLESIPVCDLTIEDLRRQCTQSGGQRVSLGGLNVFTQCFKLLLREESDLLQTLQQAKEKLRQFFAQGLELPGAPPFLGQVVAVITSAAQTLGGETLAMFQHLFALA